MNIDSDVINVLYNIGKDWTLLRRVQIHCIQRGPLKVVDNVRSKMTHFGGVLSEPFSGFPLPVLSKPGSNVSKGGVLFELALRPPKSPKNHQKASKKL